MRIAGGDTAARGSRQTLRGQPARLRHIAEPFHCFISEAFAIARIRQPTAAERRLPYERPHTAHQQREQSRGRLRDRAHSWLSHTQAHLRRPTTCLEHTYT